MAVKTREDLYNRSAIKGDCIEYTGGKTRGGYGQVFFEGKVRRAHRLAYFFANGDLPKDLDVLHKCDNPSCINPAHLFLGTAKDNIKDMYAKGRGRKNLKRNRRAMANAEELLATLEIALKALRAGDTDEQLAAIALAGQVINKCYLI